MPIMMLFHVHLSFVQLQSVKLVNLQTQDMQSTSSALVLCSVTFDR